MKTDFTEGNVLKQLIFFSGPIILANLLQISFQFVDSLWVGNLLGAKALGATAVSGTVFFTVLSFVLGINNAALTILSQQKGKDDKHGLASYVNAFVVIMTVMSLLLGIIGFIAAEPLLALLQTPDNMMHFASGYLKIHFIGIIFLFGYNFISTVLRAVGDSQTPLRFVLIAVILNLFLDPLFISVFHLGIFGAAYATVLSQGIAFIYGMVYTVRKGLVPFALPKLPSLYETSVILRLGIPAGLQMVVISGGSMAIMSVVNSFGESVVSGFGAVQRIDSLLILPAMAIGTAVNSMAGQTIGSGDMARTKKIANYGVLYVMIFMLTISAAVFFAGYHAVKLFISEVQAAGFGEQYLRTVAFFYPFIGINFVLNGVVRASGAMFQILILNIISFWALRYPFSYMFSSWIGENGIALGIGMSFLLSSLTAFLYYRFGKWKDLVLFEKEKSTPSV
ncbi:MATE family efflux transporter [Bacillus sonorensis]|uniref:Multidrug resistance protein YpnP n=2 Tax=Bacillus sonorensis TaxID=119858 RepID=M5PA70_9BACI|nr:MULTISPECIES: MATE family efflux transporter [Bacillus]TWK82455.1 Multidrug export protein MepA [Bacillus paralicheniformis]ASB88808.1 putative multidrug resistance protein YpnP [Bacillus sonorensis]EME76384.1 multidrug resistance protein YpnP [Bacillus sonorensis L12]MCY8089522.1 MATE family efflux transporter [Bacillus sonorensis]MCZ0072120.1 MATE family efflux transporter [Bacillus sonorensis]